MCLYVGSLYIGTETSLLHLPEINIVVPAPDPLKAPHAKHVAANTY
jgi:hypothetical protein